MDDLSLSRDEVSFKIHNYSSVSSSAQHPSILLLAQRLIPLIMKDGRFLLIPLGARAGRRASEKFREETSARTNQRLSEVFRGGLAAPTFRVKITFMSPRRNFREGTRFRSGIL